MTRPPLKKLLLSTRFCSTTMVGQFRHDMSTKSKIQKPPNEGLVIAARTCPKVYVIKDLSQVDGACSMLKRTTYKILSFDTETTVTRKINPSVPSVLQLASFKHCFIFQIYQMLYSSGKQVNKFPEPLAELLSSTSIVKIGVASPMDADKLEASYPPLKHNSVFDLQSLSCALNIPASIAKFSMKYADPIYRDKPLDHKTVWKDHLKRKWDNFLNRDEVNYASKDVFAVLSGLRTLIRTPQPDLLPLSKQLFNFQIILDKFDD